MAFEAFYRGAPHSMEEDEIDSFMTSTMEEIEYFKQLFEDYRRMDLQGLSDEL